MSAPVTVPLDLLQQLVDGDACSFDFHGGCQSHMYLHLEPGEVCPQQRLKDLLTEHLASTRWGVCYLCLIRVDGLTPDEADDEETIRCTRCADPSPAARGSES